jgi:uncharacterized membrane protein YuzA (DUF378 family)
MKIPLKIASILVLVGAINWGLDKLLKFDLVEKALGTGGWAMLVYGAIAASGVYVAYTMRKEVFSF